MDPMPRRALRLSRLGRGSAATAPRLPALQPSALARARGNRTCPWHRRDIEPNDPCCCATW